MNNSRLILEILKKSAQATNIILNILIGGHNQRYQGMKRRALYPTMPDSKIKKTPQNEKQSFYSLLYQLKKQGFIKKEKKNNKTRWIITALGKEKLKKLKNIFHFPKLFYKKEKDNGLNIITFDIPEKEKSKRNWLRQALLILEFEMLQKSVWISHNKLPEEFLKDLIKIDLIKFVHIFKITKTGTIKKCYKKTQ